MSESGTDLFELLEEGYYALSTQDLAAAQNIADKTSALAPEHPEVSNYVGALQMAKGDYGDALSNFKSAISVDPGFIGALLNATQALANMERYDEAAAYIAKARDWPVSDEDRIELLLQEVMLKTRGHKVEEALALCRELPETCDEPSLAFRMGQWLFDLGEVDRAEALIEGAVQAGYLVADSVYYQGLLRSVRQDRVGAVVSFLKTRELDAISERPPWQEPTHAFEKRVGLALSQISEPERTQLDGALVLVLPLPSPELICEGIDPRLPLLIEPTRGERDMVTRVFVYQRNLERTVLAEKDLDARIMDELLLEAREAFKPTSRHPAARK